MESYVFQNNYLQEQRENKRREYMLLDGLVEISFFLIK